MRSPEQVLKALNKHGKVSDYKFERLYRILFNEEMFHVAYQRIYAKPGNMTPGTDGKTINRMSLQRINKVIASLRDESYKPNPAKRIYIPKKNGKKRPLGIPSFEDKLVQEVVRMILEAVYEEVFANTSHGFRPNRSCHTALTHIQKTFTGTKWFVEGDIKGFFDNIDHNVLIATLRKRIADDRFLRLIRKLLNAGYIDDWKFHNTNKGTPQGGNISPILANIYLDNFDKYMEEYALRFNKGKERHITKEYKQLSDKMQRILKSIKNIQDADVRLQLRDEYEKLRRERQKIESRDSMDETYRRLRYVRYADDFLIGVIGSKAECVKIKSDITKYMEENLKLELSQEKTLITNAQKPAKFLGFDVSVRKSDAIKRDKNNVPARYYNGKIVLKVAIETVRNKLEEYSAIRYKVVNGNAGSNFGNQMKNNLNKYAGFSLNIPLFNRLATRNRVRTARLQQTNLALQLDNTKKVLYKEIQQAWYNAIAAESKFKSSESAVEASQESFRLMSEKFDNGKATSVEYNESKLNLTKALSDRIQAKYDYLFRTKILDFYKGQPIE